ncbi:sulfotransferase [Spongiibacter taiwanensis]|uniref:sulfotransferase family protein n=1 Tax=Spongiibacter taiwanensis TaxID=1748242 RepID=UPI0020363418|nr:sulfotransferase [Spongiibacter taiwanensis]USA42144.1 sulfotransferase [Spongiibacter taiwanensis]
MKPTNAVNDAVKPIFVFGYSRSGTKFMCNLLEKATKGKISHLGELHYFGRLSVSPQDTIGSLRQAEELIVKLSKQYIKRMDCPYSSAQEIQEVVGDVLVKNQNIKFKYQVLSIFIKALQDDLQALRLCDGTPRNSYYIEEILTVFPEARLIFMLRDPRDCIFSQKRKPFQVWDRGGKAEAFRLFFNYNPILMAKFWRSSVKNLMKYVGDDRVHLVKYEELLSESAKTLNSLADFLSIPEEDLSEFSGTIKVNNSRKFVEGLSRGEISLIEKVGGEEMKSMGYDSVVTQPLGLGLGFSYFFWLIRLVAFSPFVYILNLSKFFNAAHEIKKRIMS